jgi:hypothetical protein
MRNPVAGGRLVLAASTLTLLLAGTAHAATAPTVTTGGAARITPTTTTLTGTVNPQGHATIYSFQYGRTTAYGVTTPPTSAGSGTGAVAAAADIAGLRPNTKYHYRILATSSAGTTRGKDRTFSTAKQPLGLSLFAGPYPVPYGAPFSLGGTLSGTGNASQTIILRRNPFPFTGGLQPFGNRVVTDASGNFSVTFLNLPSTSQFQASVDGRNVSSPVITVPVVVRVGTEVSRTRVVRGGRVRFTGSIRPARDGARVSLQKRDSRGRWVSVAHTTARHRDAGVSTYRRTIRVRRGGRYRVHVTSPDGYFASNAGRTVVIHTFHRR